MMLAFTVMMCLQAAAPAASQAAPAVQAAPANAAPYASSVLRPAMGSLQQALAAIRPDKWKMSSAVRAETAANVASISRDMDGTLPGLVIASDAAPDSVDGGLLVSRNVGALYDVLLRVTLVAESAAPRDQAEALEQARADLDSARRALDDRLQSAASAQAQQVAQLRAALRTAQAAAAVLVASPPPPQSPPAKKKKPAPKKPASIAAQN